MADIDLEKRSRTTWMWIPVLLVALLLGYLAWSTLTRSPRDADVVMTPVGVEGGEMVMQQVEGTPADEVASVTGGSVERFARTCAEAPGARPAEGGATFELACMREMTNALAGLVLADTAGAGRLDDQLRELRRDVQEAERGGLTVGEDAGAFGSMARRAASLMSALQDTRAPAAQVAPEHIARAQAAAAAVGPDAGEEVLRQRLSEFFSAAAATLQALEDAGRG
jgi:hypothetical protein